MHRRTLVPRPRISERQRAANRLNARRSTGPRTAAGKRRSSLNALKHGLFTGAFRQAMEVFGEDPSEFESLHRDFILSFDPQTPFEATLVEDLARLWWKKRRLDRGENGLQVEEVQTELHKRHRELSDSDAAPIAEGDEVIQQSGLMRVKDCKMKFETAEKHLERTIAQAERSDPQCDVETLLFMLYGQQPSWRSSFIQSLADRLSEAEKEVESDNGEANLADEVGEQPPAEPCTNADDGARDGPNLQSSIENQQSFDSPPTAPLPRDSGLGPNPETRIPNSLIQQSPVENQQSEDDSSSPRVLRALLVNQLTGELLEVYRQHELYLERLADFSPAARDACLAPSGAKWILTIRNQNSIERQIDRKLKQLRTLQSLDGWGRRLRRQCASVTLRSNGGAHPRPSGGPPRLKPAGLSSSAAPLSSDHDSRTPSRDSRLASPEPRVPNKRDVKLPKRSRDPHQNNQLAPKTEAKTNRQRSRNSKFENRKSKLEKGK